MMTLYIVVYLVCFAAFIRAFKYDAVIPFWVAVAGMTWATVKVAFILGGAQ